MVGGVARQLYRLARPAVPVLLYTVSEFSCVSRKFSTVQIMKIPFIVIVFMLFTSGYSQIPVHEGEPMKPVDIGIAVDFSVMGTNEEMDKSEIKTGRDGLKGLMHNILFNLAYESRNKRTDTDIRYSLLLREDTGVRRISNLAESIHQAQSGPNLDKFKAEIDRTALKKTEKNRNLIPPVVAVRNSLKQDPGHRSVAPILIIWIAIHQPFNAAGSHPTLKTLQDFVTKENSPDIAIAMKHFQGKDEKAMVLAAKEYEKEFPVNTNTDRTIFELVHKLLGKCWTNIEKSQCYYFDQRQEMCKWNATYELYPGQNEYKKYCPAGTLIDDCSEKKECEVSCQKELGISKVTDAPCSVTCGHGSYLGRPTKSAEGDPAYVNCPWTSVPCWVKICPGETEAPITDSSTDTTSQIPTTRSTSTTETTEMQKLTKKKSDLETWQIALITMGSLTFVIVVVGITVCCACKRRRARLKHLHARSTPAKHRSPRYASSRAPTRPYRTEPSRWSRWTERFTRRRTPARSRPPPASYGVTVPARTYESPSRTPTTYPPRGRRTDHRY